MQPNAYPQNSTHARSVAEECARDFFSLAPQYRTKEQLINFIQDAIEVAAAEGSDRP